MPAAPNRRIVETSIAALTNSELATELLDEYDELNRRFHLADYRPSELSGGRFSEAAFRICQLLCLGSYTPLGTTLPRVDQLLARLEQTPAAKVDDSFRIHIPRALRLIYDLRNKRDVAHLGKGVSPNLSDASLILGTAGWVLAEIVRISHQCDIATAQSIVDDLVQRRLPLIWQEGDAVRVLEPSLTFKQQVLLILYHFSPAYVEERKLFEWVEYSAISDFRKNVLRPLHSAAMIQYKNGEARILPPGLREVEAFSNKQS